MPIKSNLYLAGAPMEEESIFLNLQLLTTWGVFEHADLIAEVSAQASGESSLEVMLKNVGLQLNFNRTRNLQKASGPDLHER